MKKYYGTAVRLLLMTGLVIALTGAKKPVYAAEETEEVTQETGEASDVQTDEVTEDESSLPQETSDDTQDVQNSAYQSVSISDGKTISGSIPDDAVPLLFHKTTVDYQGQTVEAVQFDNGDIILVYVTDASGNSSFMRYDASAGELSDFRMIQGPGENYIMVLEPDESVVPPVGYEEAVLDWNGQSLTAFVNTSSVLQSEAFTDSDTQPSDYFLLYALSSSGRKGFYLYDQAEGTYQRYLDLAAAGGSTSSSGKLIDFAAVKDGDGSALVRLIIISVMILIIILLIVTVIILAIKLKDYAGYEYIDEEEYNAVRGGSYEPQSGAGAAQANFEEREDAADFGDKPDESRKPSRSAHRQQGADESSEDVRNRHGSKNQTRTAPQRRDLLATGDIEDLDDILADTSLTSDLPSKEQIDRAVAKKSAPAAKSKTESRKKSEADYENMQVTVDSFSAGMPAMVDTDIIADDIDGHVSNDRTPSGRITGEMEFARDQYSDEQYGDEYYYNNDDGYSDDEYYGLSKKERKALEKQRRREEKEAQKDAEYMEKERRKAEKRKKYGYAEPTAMDWASFSAERSEEKDDRKPYGGNAQKVPAYMMKNAGTQDEGEKQTGADKHAGKNSEVKAKQTASQKTEKPVSEAERAEAAADAVIRAARGDGYMQEEARKKASEEEYRAYRQGARNQYEEFRRSDEEEARLKAIEANGRSRAAAPQNPGSQPRPTQQQRPGRQQRPVQQAGPGQQQRPAQQPPRVEYKQDLDEDFEFDFLDIKRPQ